MKTLIATIASVLILLFFPLQNALDTINNQKMHYFHMIVHKSTQTARVDGYFTQDNIDVLTQDLLNAFPGLDAGDIYIDVTTTPKYRTDEFDDRERILYDIKVPIENVIAAHKMFGINDADNSFTYGESGYVLSEVLMP